MTTTTFIASVADLRTFLSTSGPFDVAIWDFDGVIGDTEPVQARVYREMLNERGVDAEDDFFADLAGRPEPEIWTALKQRYDVQGEISDLRSTRIERVTPILASQVPPNWFVRPGIAALQEANVNSLVISSGNEEVVVRYLEAWGLSSLFEQVSATTGERADVPKQERLQRVIESAGSALVVEDSAEYLRIAADLGAVTLGVEHTLNSEPAKAANAILRGGTERA